MDPRTEKMLAERAQRNAATPAPLRAPLAVAHDGRRWVKTHANAARLIAGAAVAALFAGYYLIVTLPAQRADRMELQARAAESVKAETTMNHTAVSDCLSKAKADADARWDAACKARRQGPNCPLPEHQAETYERDESNARNACLLGH